ncbi:N-6 DNA methylase [Streptomyces sp. NPDC049577]|uniref:N-6 DNA methylase n=1 Tax=Streptomyces sp. NPDC049577 TaxID=3155153 RepID=UPI00344AF899
MTKSAGPSSVSVTLAEIARIAGVGRAAVSNWRRRYETFPTPVGGTDTSPQFSLDEVEDWLRQENKIKSPVSPWDRLWPEYEALGDRDAAGGIVARVGLRLSGAEAPHVLTALPPLDGPQSDLLDRTVQLVGPGCGPQAFHQLLERWLRAHVRHITVTPEPLAELVATVARSVHCGPVHTVLDPACGSGSLLLAAGRRWNGGERALGFRAQDSDPVLAALTTARLALAGQIASDLSNLAVAVGDTLRADAHAAARADVVLCNPPSNERDWGHGELATDMRWVYGQPPRTESELAWVQHAVASLAPEGVAVLVLPPAVAARRAGRRIRAGLLRAGVLRAVIALPPGAAPPYGVGLHLWVLSPEGSSGQRDTQPEVLLIDATHGLHPTAGDGGGFDWASVTAQVVKSLEGRIGHGSISIPVVELLDERVDLTPARHIPGSRAATMVDLRRAWARFDVHMGELHDASRALSTLAPAPDGDAIPLISVAELERAEAVEILTGQTLPEPLVRRGERGEDEARVLIGPPLPGLPELWLPAAAVARGERDGSLTVTASQDVIVCTLARSFDARIETDAPSVLGPQVLALRVDPAVLDPWFLAGCLRAPANVRQAGTHASTSSRIDVRRLQVPRFSLAEQRRYGDIYRKVSAFERGIDGLKAVGSELTSSLGDLLAAGRLPGA